MSAGRKFETKVFRATGGKKADLSAIDECGYRSEKTAEAGHLRMCKRWERKARQHMQAKVESMKKELASGEEPGCFRDHMRKGKQSD